MGSAISLYFRLIGTHLKGKLQYKASFIMEAIGQFLIAFLDFAVVAVLLNRFPTMKGWSLNELAFLYGISATSFSLAQLISRGFEVFERYIQMGELDRVLTRPVSPFLQILSIELALNRIGRLGQGLVVFSIGLSGLAVHWDAGKVVLLFMTVIAGVLVFLSLFVMGAVTTIWTVSTTEFTNIFTHGGTYLTSYPMTIYEEWFRNLFTFIIPLGFVSFLPATLILEKPLSADWSSNLPTWIGWLPLPTAIVFFGLALLTWHWGLKKYQSTGT